MSLDQWLTNERHEWLSRPHSMLAWRLSGGRRMRARVYHAGLDFISFCCMYLEPVLAFTVDGEKPEAAGRQWRPSELTGHYRTASASLAVSATMPGPESLMARVILTNQSQQTREFKLAAYGEADRVFDPEDAIDIDVHGSGFGKNLLHAKSRRLAPRHVVSLCAAHSADSHRGGLVDYTRIRNIRWHHAYTAVPLAIVLPPGGAPADAENQWRQEWALKLAAGESHELVFALAGSYQARDEPQLPEQVELFSGAAALARRDYGAVVADNAAYWHKLLQRVPEPPADLEETLRKVYYRAWTCIWQLVTPGFDTGRIDGLRFPEACVMCSKADHRAFMPADWETGLGALLLSQIDPALGAQILDSQMAAVEVDGIVPENLVNCKENMLPFITTYEQWQIYRRLGDRPWLERHYPAQKRSLWAHYRHLNFKRRGEPTLRNTVYVHIGFIYLLKIAEELNLPARELECNRWMVEETRQIVQSFWDEDRNHFADSFKEHGAPEERGFIKESSVQSMVSLFAGATAEQVPCLLRDLREKYYAGEYGIRESGSQGGSVLQPVELREQDLGRVNTFKHSNFMYFIPGLLKADPELCREVCLRTVHGIAKNGDFHEQMRCNMDQTAFGPMSVFGAFAYITCVQMLGRLGGQEKPSTSRGPKAERECVPA